MLRIDFHVHTSASPDSPADIRQVLECAKKRNLDAIVISDHDTIRGYHEARKHAQEIGIQVIPAIEYTLPYGEYGLHLIALYSEEEISFSGISDYFSFANNHPVKTIIPHPYRNGTGLMYHYLEGNISQSELNMVINQSDFVEIINTKDREKEIISSLEFACQHNLPFVAGTDAHRPSFIGFASTLVKEGDLANITSDSLIGVEAFTSASSLDIDDVIANLKTGNPKHFSGSRINLRERELSIPVVCDQEFLLGHKVRINKYKNNIKLSRHI